MSWYNPNYLYRKKITISANDVPISYTSTIFSGGSASASSSQGGDVASNAFDINTGTWWTSSTSGPLPVWLKYDLGSGVTKIATKFEITPRVADANAKLVNFTFEGSNDDSDWTVLHTVTGETWLNDTPKSYTFNNTTAYRYYRLYITSTSGGNYAQVTEFKSFESINPALANFDLDVFLDADTFDFTKALASGDDVIFTASDEITLLKFERRVHDSINEVGHYKVKVPEVSSLIDTDIYIYYGYDGASDLSDPTNVYDSYFKAVLSLDQSGDGSVGEFLDSTANNHDGQGGAGTPGAVPTQVAGLINKAQDFDGGDYISLPDSADWDWATSDFTISFLVYFDSVSGYQCFLGRPTSGSSYLYLAKEGSNIRFRDYNGGPDMSAGWSPSISTWYRMFVTRNGSNFKIYANNTLILSASSAKSFIARDVPLQIGANSAISYFVNGLMDEVKISVGIDRGDTYRVVELLSETDDLLSFSSEETNPNDLFFNLNESIIWNEELSSDITIQLDESIIWNEENQSFGNEFFTIDESIIWNEVVDEKISTKIIFDVDESIVWNDEKSEDISINLDESVVWNEESQATIPQGTANYASKIISVNPLIFVTDTIPAKITKVDTTDPDNVTWSAVSIIGLNNANDVVYNSQNGYLYIGGANGKVAKILLNDLSDQTIIDLSDTDNITLVNGYFANGFIFAVTDKSTEEIYTIDERDTFFIDNNFSYLQENKFFIDNQLNFTEAFFIDNKFPYLYENKFFIDNTLTWLEDTPVEIIPIGQEDFKVYLDDVELLPGDLKLDDITITHTIDSTSSAVFKLARRHDDIDKTIAGATSIISNQNNVKIYIKDNLEIDGTIAKTDLTYDRSGEIVSVSILADEPDSNKKSINLGMPGLNEYRTLFHIISCNETIENPVMDERLIIVNQNSRYWSGTEWVFRKNQAMFFNDYDSANSYYNSVSVYNQKFWKSEPKITNAEENPIVYTGVIADLGDKIEQNVIRLVSLSSDLDEYNNQTLRTLPNWAYFWFIRVRDFIRGIEMATSRYVGTSPFAIVSKTFKSLALTHRRQRELPDIITKMGTYSVGKPPYLEFSKASGRLITKDKWIDESDGLYRHRDAGYNYTAYLKKLVNLEYEKLQNINGDVLPITSANINISLNAYYFYALKLLTRINIVNTINPTIFTKENGFPIAIKSITIKSSDMVVSLSCDNQKTRSELEAIVDKEPDKEDYEYDEEHVLNFRKFDTNTFSDVE